MSCGALFSQAFHGQLESPPVKITVVDAVVGRGLVATRNIKRGEIIFTESAAVSVAEETGVPSCSYCLCSLAGVEASPLLTALPHQEHFDPPPPHCSCPNCGMVYCGERCRAKAESLFHRRLCGSKAAFEAFLSSCDDHTRLVAHMMLKIVAMMLQETQRNGGDSATACEPFLRWTAQRNAAEPLQLPLPQFHEAIRRELRLTTEEEGWLTEVMLDRISAMVCLNSIQIRMRSPFSDYFGAVKRRVSSEEERRIAVEEMLKLAGGIPASEADAFFHQLCGTRGAAMFALHACCNHSCDPVAEVRCQGFGDHTIDVVATVDIFRGDPVTITYVNPKLRWIQRCEVLQSNYGFICACPRCAIEYNKPADEEDEQDGAPGQDVDNEASDEDSDCDIDPGDWSREVEEALGNDD